MYIADRRLKSGRAIEVTKSEIQPKDSIEESRRERPLQEEAE